MSLIHMSKEAEKSNGDTTNVNTTDTNDVSEIPVTPTETTFDRLSIQTRSESTSKTLILKTFRYQVALL